MLRDKNLIPLSHQHQHALALCVRIERASPIPATDLPLWQAEIREHFQPEITVHFAAEETVLFPVARQFPELVPLVDELIADHKLLREDLSRAETNSCSADNLLDFSRRLSQHIRKEERQLFERIQKLVKRDEITILGANLQDALKAAASTCIIPNEATKLRPR